MINSLQMAKLLLTIAVLGAVAACEKAPPQPTPAASSPFKLTAGIQDIMADMIDPSADFLWQSVSSTVTAAGVEDKQPRTDEEWKEVRRHAIIVTESANLLVIEGRHVAGEGKVLEDHGTPGNLTVEEAEKAIAADRTSFVAFSHALHDAGAAMLKAADDRNVQGLVVAGEALDEACEACHLKFWYPGQQLPVFPEQPPEVKSN